MYCRKLVSKSIMYCYGLLLFLLDWSLDVAGSISQLELDRHLELGRNFLAGGQLQDALTHYHAAVEGDPSNYLTYYKRGTVYLALGKPKLALLDLDKVLELKPDFTSARLQRGTILLKQAELNDAELEIQRLLVVNPHNSDAANALHKINNVRELITVAEAFIYNNKHANAVEIFNQIIEICPWASHIRELRAKSYMALGDTMSAIYDIRSSTKLQSDNTDGYYKLATMLYEYGDVEEALKEIRECLKLDPDHKKCFKFYKRTKKIHKFLSNANSAEDSRDFDSCIENSEKIIKEEPNVQNVLFLVHHLLCKCYTQNNEPEKAVKNCQAALRINQKVDLYCDSAEAYLAAEMYDDAIRDFKQALEIDPNDSRAKQGLRKAQQRQKMSESRDYYKILNVPRTATKRDITKAYRKAAQKWHPDNFQEGEEKKRAEKMFIDIAAAKEVLTDSEKRAKFDQGEDPLDPESGKHPHGFNFQEFHHFRSSPFQFKFHFN